MIDIYCVNVNDGIFLVRSEVISYPKAAIEDVLLKSGYGEHGAFNESDTFFTVPAGTVVQQAKVIPRTPTIQMSVVKDN